MAKITRNGKSNQVVIPADICEEYGFHPGNDVEFFKLDGGPQLRKTTKDPVVSNTVYTIGYEGRTMDRFIHELLIRNIRQLIDVREIAFSRKPGFSKSALKRNLESSGITYRHISELGSPSDVRHTYKEGGSVTEFMTKYSAYLDDHQDAYDELRGFALSKTSALMCFEKEHTVCHREVLAKRLSGDGFKLCHI